MKVNAYRTTPCTWKVTGHGHHSSAATHTCKVYLTFVVFGQVVEWVLGGVRTEWQSSAFQAALDSPAVFVSHYISLHADAAGQPEVCLYAHISQSWALSYFKC